MSNLFVHSLTEVIAKACANGKRMWPHEIRFASFIFSSPSQLDSLLGDKTVVLRQGKENLAAIGIKDGSVLRFWNGKWAL